MKIIDRFILSSIIKTAIVTLAIITLLLTAVELFSKLDSIMYSDISISSILYYLALCLPKYFLMASSIAFLFGTTYFLSQLNSNNEMLPILNAGIRMARIRMPIIVLSIILSLVFSIYQEKASIVLQAEHDRVESELFNTSGTRDRRNIALSDKDSGYVIYASRFHESNMTISKPIIIKTDGNELISRIEADKAVYEDGRWIFYKSKRFIKEGSMLNTELHDSYIEEDFTLEPYLFRSQNISIDTMDSRTAIEYLARLKRVDKNSWYEKATDYFRRIASPFAIFILMFISCHISYHFKKNIFLFSIIESLSLAVVYYVGDMVFSIIGHQGIVSPYAAATAPMVATILLSFLITLPGKNS